MFLQLSFVQLVCFSIWLNVCNCCHLSHDLNPHSDWILDLECALNWQSIWCVDKIFNNLNLKEWVFLWNYCVTDYDHCSVLFQYLIIVTTYLKYFTFCITNFCLCGFLPTGVTFKLSKLKPFFFYYKFITCSYVQLILPLYYSNNSSLIP